MSCSRSVAELRNGVDFRQESIIPEMEKRVHPWNPQDLAGTT